MGRLVGIALVLMLHGAALWGLANHRLIAPPGEKPLLLFDLVAPPPPAPRPRPTARASAAAAMPARPANAAHAPAAIADPAAEALPTNVAPAAAAAVAVPPAPTPELPAAPVTLAGELAVSCPERIAPDYPLASRRRNETGGTLLRVELDETGRVSAASVLESSGSPRLDEAALSAVRRWRCNPPQRGGRAVRAIARQAFNFVLQGS